MENRNPLLGKWQIEGLYEYGDGCLNLISKYSENQILWHFTNDSNLRIYFNGELDAKTEYKYTERKLTIDNSYNEILSRIGA